MDVARLIQSLERFCDVLPAIVAGLDAEDARRRGPGGAWSVLEVVTHLADEEVEDFQTRLNLTLRGSTEPWPPIDPEGWALERRYNDGDLDETVARFTEARAASVGWLRGLDNPDWQRAYDHPQAGAIRAGDLLVSWVAHDALHLRQIAKRLYQMILRDGAGYGAEYAGRWTA